MKEDEDENGGVERISLEPMRTPARNSRSFATKPWDGVIIGLPVKCSV